MAGVPNIFAPRYSHHVLPYAVLAAAYALCWLPLWASRRWRRGSLWTVVSPPAPRAADLASTRLASNPALGHR
jgi:hypothetical protein